VTKRLELEGFIYLLIINTGVMDKVNPNLGLQLRIRDQGQLCGTCNPSLGFKQTKVNAFITLVLGLELMSTQVFGTLV